MQSIINNHNNKILNQTQENDKRTCNCINKELCPVNGECLKECTIYETTINSSDPTYTEKKYISLSEPSFKKRYANHKKSFANAKYEKETELSKEVWKIKRANHVPILKWKIRKQCAPFNRAKMRCSLCINEKLEIALYEGDNLVNKRSELISKCRHENKHTLLRHDTKD